MVALVGSNENFKKMKVCAYLGIEKEAANGEGESKGRR